jgi:hypothetical protein
LGLGFFGLFECREGLVPALLQRGANKAIVRINAQELALRKLRLVAQTLQVRDPLA